MIGQTISHYTISEKLGEGGMGVVYKARDTRLDRDVALKFLPEKAFINNSDYTRFLEEAKAAAALHHPNVCSVFDIQEHEGEQFIVMEFVDGRSLRSMLADGPMPLQIALRIALHVADGLRAAHRQGIIHRDIKPENILITKENIAKITDFGLAQSEGKRGTSDIHQLEGTIAYMSPEVLLGEEAGFATDVWSLGVVMYEMITGSKPFGGEYEQAVTYAILNEPHAPPSSLGRGIPNEIDVLLDHCLVKKAEDRLHNADLLFHELQSIVTAGAGAALSGMKKIAVLPFADMSPEKDNQYFSEGLTEEIISSLSKLPSIRILSRSTVMQFTRAGKPMKQIARELGVQYVLEGSVRKSGIDVRITTQLIDGGQDTVLWAEKYSGTMDQIFTIQENVAGKVVKALRMRLTPTERKNLKRRATENTEAYQFYLQGRFFWNKRRPEGFLTAIKYFEQAIAKDERYARAWAGISDSYNLLSEYSGYSRKEYYPKARAAVEKALEYDDRLAEAHTSFASLVMLNGWDWKTAEKEYLRAIELDPNYATAHHWYAEWLLYNGMTADAIRSISMAAELDPVSPAITKDRGMVYYYAREYDEAIGFARKTLALDAEFSTAHRLLSLAYLQKGMFAEAVEENRLWKIGGENNADAAVALAYCMAVSGKQREARGMLERIRPDQVTDGNLMRGIALVCTALGEQDRAIEWLGKAWDKKAESLSTLKVDPKLDPLRKDPRFDVLLKKVGLLP